MNIVEIVQAINTTLIAIMWLSFFASSAEVLCGEKVLNLGSAKKVLDFNPEPVV